MNRCCCTLAVLIAAVVSAAFAQGSEAVKGKTEQASKQIPAGIRGIGDSRAKCMGSPKPVKCDMDRKHWQFDPTSLKCEKHAFKCFQNGFKTREGCIEQCGKINWNKKLCLKETRHKTCDDNSTGWQFNPDEKRCTEFKRGKCRTNLNYFFSVNQCRSICGLGSTAKATEFCKMPMKVGNCKRTISRFYMNKHGKCIKFQYSGCDGNENNFVSRRQCAMICEKLGLVKSRK